MAVDSCVSRIKDYQAGMKPGRVGIVGRVDVTDVISGEVQTRQMKRRVHRVLDGDDVAVIDGDAVDLERISGFERILPSFLPKGNFAVLFRHELRLINIWILGRCSRTSATTRREKSSFTWM